jgi:hypothetical protein
MSIGAMDMVDYIEKLIQGGAGGDCIQRPLPDIEVRQYLQDNPVVKTALCEALDYLNHKLAPGNVECRLRSGRDSYYLAVQIWSNRADDEVDQVMEEFFEMASNCNLSERLGSVSLNAYGKEWLIAAS